MGSSMRENSKSRAAPFRGQSAGAAAGEEEIHSGNKIANARHRLREFKSRCSKAIRREFNAPKPFGGDRDGLSYVKQLPWRQTASLVAGRETSPLSSIAVAFKLRNYLIRNTSCLTEARVKRIFLTSLVVALILGPLTGFLSFVTSTHVRYRYEPGISEAEMQQWDQGSVGHLKAELHKREVPYTKAQWLADSVGQSYFWMYVAKTSLLPTISLLIGCMCVGWVEWRRCQGEHFGPSVGSAGDGIQN